MAWWDEALDTASGNFFQSNMWDDQWFGGNSSSTSNCVTTVEETTDYCFACKLNEVKGLSYAARENVNACYKYTNFDTFYNCIAYYPHIGGQQATGGIMTDVDSSPGDPVFYLHHTYLDRLFRQWQQINPTDRMNIISEIRLLRSRLRDG